MSRRMFHYSAAARKRETSHMTPGKRFS
jgi:hypothetical protein